MWKNLIAAARTSEFWAGVFVAVTEVIPAPIPDDLAGEYSTARVVAVVYMALRVWSKVVKKIPDPKTTSTTGTVAAFLLGSVLLAAPAKAQDPISQLDVGQRAHVTVNGGGMVLTTGQDWSGASLGGAVLYNLHEKFSVFGGYDHGFPVNDVDEHLDLWRVVGSLRVHPNAFVGFGYAWFSEGVEGGLAQFLVTKQVAPRLAVGGMYAHVFSREELEDFEYARVYVNYHLFGKE